MAQQVLDMTVRRQPTTTEVAVERHPSGPAALLDGSSRVVAATHDPALVLALRERAGARALALVPGAAPHLVDGVVPVVPLTQCDQLADNNAEVVLVDGRLGALLADADRVAHASWVVVTEPADGPSPALDAARRHVADGRLRPAGSAALRLPSGTAVGLRAFEVRCARPDRGALRWVSPELGHDGLLRALAAAGVRHAVLPGDRGGLDLLVSPEGRAYAEALLDHRPGCQPLRLLVPGTAGCAVPAPVTRRLLSGDRRRRAVRAYGDTARPA